MKVVHDYRLRTQSETSFLFDPRQVCLGAIATADERGAIPATVQDTGLSESSTGRLLACGAHVLLQLGTPTVQQPKCEKG